MIGRADIEGSKSNVAMNACAVPHASYACGVGKGKAGPGGWGIRRTFKWQAAVLLICPYNDLTSIVSLLWHYYEMVTNICHYIYILTFLSQDDVIFFWHHCEGHGADIHFHRETWVGERLVFALLTREVGVTKT